MNSELRLILALGLLLVFAVQESGYWGPRISARVIAWWRRRQIRKIVKHHQQIQREWNPRTEAYRTFLKG